MMLLSLCAPINALPSTPHVIHAFVRLLNGPMFLNWVQWHLFSEVSQISWSFLCAHLIFWNCFCCNNSLWWFSPLTVPLGDHKSGLYFWDISGILHIVDIQICVVRMNKGRRGTAGIGWRAGSVTTLPSQQSRSNFHLPLFSCGLISSSIIFPSIQLQGAKAI